MYDETLIEGLKTGSESQSTELTVSLQVIFPRIEGDCGSCTLFTTFSNNGESRITFSQDVT